MTPRRPRLAVAAVAALTLAGLTACDQAKGVSGWRDTEGDLATVRREVAEMLADPQSAYFEDVRLMRYRVPEADQARLGKVSLFICGAVRGRNALGGMQGPVRFYYDDAAYPYDPAPLDAPPILASSARVSVADLDAVRTACAERAPGFISARSLDWNDD